MTSKAEEIFKKIKVNLDGKYDHKLEKTTKIEEFSGELRELLENLYSDNSPNLKFLATLINGMVTEKITAFLMTQKLMANLVEIDHKNGNLNRKTMSGDDYKLMRSLFFNKGYFYNIEERSKKDHGDMWSLNDREIMKLIGDYLNDERSFDEYRKYLDEDGWPVDGVPITDELLQAGDKYRQELMKEITELEDWMKEHYQAKRKAPPKKERKDQVLDEILEIMGENKSEESNSVVLGDEDDSLWD